jgi:hypothetical protein
MECWGSQGEQVKKLSYSKKPLDARQGIGERGVKRVGFYILSTLVKEEKERWFKLLLTTVKGNRENG